jgi:membrane protein implicated in regulation of membrane protease activity
MMPNISFEADGFAAAQFQRQAEQAQEISMKHLISLALLLGAVVAYAAGVGPFFFGSPVIGGVLLAAALVLEVFFWRRVLRKNPSSARPSGPG